MLIDFRKNVLGLDITKVDDNLPPVDVSACVTLNFPLKMVQHFRHYCKNNGVFFFGRTQFIFRLTF